MSSTEARSIWTITLENETEVSIPWSVSSESGGDDFYIILDDYKTEAFGVSGVSSGTINTTLSAGTHSLSATYSKNGGGDNGSDCATITLTPVGD